MGLSWPTIQSVHDHMYVWYEYCLCCILIWFHNHCMGRLPRYVYGFSAWVCIYVNVIMCTRVCLLLLISVDMRRCVCVCFSLSFGASRNEVSPRASSSHTPLLSQFPPCEAASPPPPFPLHLAPPFALFSHDTLNQAEINADEAFTVSLSPSFWGWKSRWQQHWGKHFGEAFSESAGCLCTVRSSATRLTPLTSKVSNIDHVLIVPCLSTFSKHTKTFFQSRHMSFFLSEQETWLPAWYAAKNYIIWPPLTSTTVPPKKNQRSRAQTQRTFPELQICSAVLLLHIFKQIIWMFCVLCLHIF